jgi:RNA polymerase sigma factor (sigma-70 family)
MQEATLSIALTAEQNQRIAETVEREQARLRNFIRKRVADAADAEDILQEVFYELVEAYRAMQPIEQVSAWLFRVARNRITDLFRKKKPVPFASEAAVFPEAAYARNLLLEEFEAAVDELSADQREVFIAHEIEGRSFKEMSAETGLSVNALHLRKHYAVLQLRERLQAAYDEFMKG